MKPVVYQFDPFELDLRQQELRRRGIRLRLPASRIRLLHLLITRRGDLVSRDEISALLWPDAPNVDVVSGINTAINQLRTQLGDDPAAPRFIETVIGSGYRFIGPVLEIEPPPDSAPRPVLAPEPVAPEPPGPAESAVAEPVKPLPVRKPPPRRWVLVTCAVVLVAAFLAVMLRPAVSRRMAHPPDLELTRVTDTGDVQFADISPDGKYVGYVRGTGGEQSLWLKQLATGRQLELAPLGKAICPGLAFSPDGSYVYYVRKDPLAPAGELYRVTFLGGSPVKVLDGISGVPAISPDGRKVAFIRSTLETHGEDSVVTAALDGSGEKTLASYPAPGIHFNRITWTSDGATLVYPLQSSFMAISAEGGTPQSQPRGNWLDIDDLSRLPPGRDLIVVGQPGGSLHSQVFDIPDASESPRAITHDLSEYRTVRATAQGDALLAVQDLVLTGIQVLAPGSPLAPSTLHGENQDGVQGLAWTPEGNLLYRSGLDRWGELLESGPGNAPPRRLADPGPDQVVASPAVSARGGFIAAELWSQRDISRIWRLDRSGAPARPLTAGTQDLSPSITPDGKWVVYSSVQNDTSVLMKVPSDGGPAVQLTGNGADHPAVSPDGTRIACSYILHPNQPPSLAIVPIAGGPPAKVFPLPETAALPVLGWTPDGRAIAFINNVNGVGNIWQQPVAGGPPAPVTSFESGKIFRFQWSSDGRLAISRGTETVDAVLLRNFR